MYVDGVVVASLVTVATVFAILVYLGYYGYHRLREEGEKVQMDKQKNFTETLHD